MRAPPETVHIPVKERFIQCANASSLFCILRSAIRMGGFHYEFFGPVGTLLCTCVLPLVIYGLNFLSNKSGCLQLYHVQLPSFDSSQRIVSWQGICVAYAWFFGHLMLHRFLPAKEKEGVIEPDGSRWLYRLNGLQNLLLTYLPLVYFSFVYPVIPLSWVADHFLEVLSGATILAVSLSVSLYCTSFLGKKVLADSGTSGYFTYDFWMGRELNPRTGRVDWKEFCELTPGLIGWACLNLAFAQKQFQEQGQVSLEMILINAFQLLYVLDGLWFQPSILSTMDITSEGFGYMLVFGDLVWVPFTYGLQAKYIAEHSPDVPWPMLAAACVLKVVGYATFRGANSQKDTFRRSPAHPSVQHIQTLQTQRGTKLMYSGWWGVARHINYTGDWLMGLSWCMCTGGGCVVPYFYAVYFAILLMHREQRDDHACKLKYGSDWGKYCKLVPWRLIPYVY